MTTTTRRRRDSGRTSAVVLREQVLQMLLVGRSCHRLGTWYKGLRYSRFKGAYF